LEIVSPVLKEGLVTFEKMHIRMYRSNQKNNGSTE